MITFKNYSFSLKKIACLEEYGVDAIENADPAGVEHLLVLVFTLSWRIGKQHWVIIKLICNRNKNNVSSYVNKM